MNEYNNNNDNKHIKNIQERFKNKLMIKSNSLNDFSSTILGESVNLNDVRPSSPVSIVNAGTSISSPLSGLKSNISSPPRQIYEAPARLSAMSQNQTKKRSLTLTDYNDDNFLILENSSHLSQDIIELVKNADSGLKAGVEPSLCDDAMGGTYFLRDKQKNNLLVCKPGNEEPNSPQHPARIKCSTVKSYGTAYKGRIVPGFSMFREVAAYILDDGFSGVPETALGKIRMKLNPNEGSEVSLGTRNSGAQSGTSWSLHGYKLCSLQRYIRHECSSEDLSSSNFLIEDVHRIAILDIRLCNLDRHQGNILVCKSPPFSKSEEPTVSKSAPIECSFDKIDLNLVTSRLRLVPIDHGYCLPHILSMNEANLSWLSWSQAKSPISSHLRDYIKHLDVDKDIKILKKQIGAAIPETALITLVVCTLLLQKGIEEGLSLYDIGSLMINKNITQVNEFSPLQEAVNQAIKKTFEQNNSRTTYFQNGPSSKKILCNNFPLSIFTMDNEDFPPNDSRSQFVSEKADKNPNPISAHFLDDILGFVIDSEKLRSELNHAIENLVKNYHHQKEKE